MEEWGWNLFFEKIIAKSLLVTWDWRVSSFCSVFSSRPFLPSPRLIAHSDPIYCLQLSVLSIQIQIGIFCSNRISVQTLGNLPRGRRPGARSYSPDFSNSLLGNVIANSKIKTMTVASIGLTLTRLTKVWHWLNITHEGETLSWFLAPKFDIYPIEVPTRTRGIIIQPR